MSICQVCGGAGVVYQNHLTSPVRCDVCDGSGTVRHVIEFKVRVVVPACGRCNGTGTATSFTKPYPKKCQQCGGAGAEDVIEEVENMKSAIRQMEWDGLSYHENIKIEVTS